MPAWFIVLAPYLPAIAGALGGFAGGFFHATQKAANTASLAKLQQAQGVLK